MVENSCEMDKSEVNEKEDCSLEKDNPKDIEIAEPKKLRYPLQVFFIISNEFCERCMIYGMRTILALYATRKLLMDNDAATLLYHGNKMFIYFTCMFGAILSDTWLGRFKTILYLSIVYAIGGIILAVSAIPNTPLPPKETLYVGLLLISLGAGGIKPCVSAFGGDQFKLPEQAVQLSTFFSLFYCSINAGGLISTFVTPILREDVHCFGETDCYSIAFGVPAVLMIISIVIFLMGKPMYNIIEPKGNVLVKVTSCIMTAITTKRKQKNLKRREHFLDYAIETHGVELVRDTKVLLRILVLYMPLPFFWALFDQQGSRWTFQATKMDGDIGIYTIKPDQFHILNPLLVLFFVPLTNALVYPIITKIGINTPLRKLTLGGMLAALAFVFSGLVETELQKSEPILPNNHHAQIRLFNGFPCDYDVQSNISGSERFTLEALQSFQVLQLPLSARENFDLKFRKLEIENATGLQQMNETYQCPEEFHRYIEASPNKASSLFISGENQSSHDFYTDQPNRSRTGIPLIRFLIAAQQSRKLEVRNKKHPTELLVNSDTNNNLQFTALAETFDVVIDEKLVGSIALKQGSVTTVIISETDDTSFGMSVIEIVSPNSMSMLWQIPQYITLTYGEIVFAVTGLEFSYAQAPKSMKSVMQACWLLTVAIGNAILMIIVKIKIFESQANEFFLFATIMALDMGIFTILARWYNRVQTNKDEVELVPLKSKE